MTKQGRTFVASEKVYLSPTMRKYYQDKVNGIKAMLNGTVDTKNPWTYTPRDYLDIGQAQKALRKYQQILDEQTPPEVKGKTKDVLWKRARELERRFTKEMPTKDEMMGKMRLNDIGKVYREAQEDAVRKNMYWKGKYSKDIEEWQQIMRTLEPDDPNITNVERLRKGH